MLVFCCIGQIALLIEIKNAHNSGTLYILNHNIPQLLPQSISCDSDRSVKRGNPHYFVFGQWRGKRVHVNSCVREVRFVCAGVYNKTV